MYLSDMSLGFGVSWTALCGLQKPRSEIPRMETNFVDTHWGVLASTADFALKTLLLEIIRPPGCVRPAGLLRITATVGTDLSAG